MSVFMTIVAENKVGPGMGIIGEHGFSAYLDAGGHKVLWDTGQGFCLSHNARRLGVELGEVEVIALSHGHFDHTGGLATALKAAAGCEVVCHPACFEAKKVRRSIFGKTVELYIGAPKTQAEFEALGGRFRFEEDTVEIAPGIHFFTSIPMEADFERIEPGFFIDDPDGPRNDNFPDDACLGLVTDKGLSVILGCAHRGMINSLLHVRKRLAADRIYSVWGGTHMMGRTPEEVEATIAALRELQVERIGTAHCTGFANEVKLARALPERFAFAHVGLREEL